MKQNMTVALKMQERKMTTSCSTSLQAGKSLRTLSARPHVAQSCYSVIGDKPFLEQTKIRPSVTLYSLDRSLPNLVWLIKSLTPTQMPILVKFGSVGNSPQIYEI